MEQKLEKQGQHFCVLVCNFLTAKFNCYRRENLHRHQYRFHPITFMNSVVPSPCETQWHVACEQAHLFGRGASPVLGTSEPARRLSGTRMYNV